MNTKVVKKLLISAICGWIIAFILGYLIGGNAITGWAYGGSADTKVVFWLFMSLAPGGLGGIITTYIYERLSEKDNK